MAFSTEEKQQLLAIRGVGPTVIERLEQLGFNSLAQMAEFEALDIIRQMARLVGSSCWHNSPIAKASIADIIILAKQRAQETSTEPVSSPA